MGDHYPVTVIVTSWSEETAIKIHDLAMKHVPARTSDIIGSPGNGWRSFVIVTDGFKISGDLHVQEQDKLKAFLSDVHEQSLEGDVLVVSKCQVPVKGTMARVQSPRKYLGLPSDDPYSDDEEDG